MSNVDCPRCGNKVTELQSLDPAVLAKIRDSGNSETIPPKVCGNCFAQLVGGIARGSVLLAREKAKENKRLMLWKSRVHLIKKARACMNEKMFSDAAVAYEKYIKVLEMVFDVKPGNLSPEQFKDSARTQELTIVASTYWDLLRIYDTSSKYGERQLQAAKKLALFLKFTPIYPDIIKRAEAFSRQAKNPSAVKQFIKMAQEQKGSCFIATAAFESPLAPEVIYLQNFRDRILIKSFWGRIFVKVYYLLSPAAAWFLNRLSPLKAPVRATLRGLIRFLAHRQ